MNTNKKPTVRLASFVPGDAWYMWDETGKPHSCTTTTSVTSSPWPGWYTVTKTCRCGGRTVTIEKP